VTTSAPAPTYGSGMHAAIDVTDLRKRFGSTTALNGMTFGVEPGQVTGFVGPNGAGKSTTMRVILGLDAARCRRSPPRPKRP
jgi:ABC-type branched-subunit amino acid transport system ATPase component